VLGQIGRVPGHGTVVGIVVAESQTVVSRGGSDDEVDGERSVNISMVSSYSRPFRAL
jgi:hypothetical protein